MNQAPFIVAEAAQGFEGDPGILRLLVCAAAKAGADAVKLQIVFADEVAVPGYAYYDLFRQLEMAGAEWRAIRDLARAEGKPLDLTARKRASAISLRRRPRLLCAKR